MVGVFTGFNKTSAIAFGELQPVLDRGEEGGKIRLVRLARHARCHFVESDDLAVEHQPMIALLGNERETFLQGELLRKGKIESNQHLRNCLCLSGALLLLGFGLRTLDFGLKQHALPN